MNAPEIVDRSTYLGSSDAAAILGVSKWRTPLEVWRSKVYPAAAVQEEDPMRTKILRRGRLMEPVIRQMAVEDFDLHLTETNVRHAHPVHEWMRAEIDFETLEAEGQFVNNDCKSVSPFAADQWGDEGTDEIPIDYHAQFQYGLMVTGRQRCDVWALFGSDDLVRYVVHRDEETIAGMRAKCISFWHDHVLAKKAPPPVTIDDVEFLMRRLRGVPVPATAELLDMIAEYRSVKQTIKGGEDRVEDLKFEIIDAMRLAAEEANGRPLGEDDASIVDPDTRKALMTWRAQRTDRIDVTRLRADAPDIAERFTTSTVSRVLRLSKSK